MIGMHAQKTTRIFPQFLLTAFCVFAPFSAYAEAPAFPEKKIITQEIAPLQIKRSSSVKETETLSTAQASPIAQKTASLSFSWNMPVNLSVFKRDKVLWIVFDHSQNVDIEKMQASANELADSLIQIPHNHATIIRVGLKPGVKSHVRREGLLWIIDLFTGDKETPFKELPVFTQYSGQKHAYLFIPTQAAGEIVRSLDPVIGDHLVVATISSMDTGIKTAYHYPEFDLLQSSQGIAIVQKAPDIIVSRGNTGITIRALNRSLYISENLDQIKRQLLLGQEAQQTGFSLKTAQKMSVKDFNSAIQQLNQDILQAGKDQKLPAQEALVKYYLTQGLGSEALRLLEQIKKENEGYSQKEKYHALKGVANFLLHRYEEAVENFSFGKLPDINEAVFWRTLASSAHKFRKEDAAVLFSYMGLIKDYPDEIKERIALVAADISIKAGNDIAAQNFIDIIKARENPLVDRSPQMHYLLAQKYVTQDYSRNALLEYHKAAESNSDRYSALARYDEAVLSNNIGAITAAQAIDELEKLRMSWREMPFTINLLTSLSGLYVKNQDYYNALRTLNEALPLADEKHKKILTNKMIRLFEDIYYHNQDKNIPAIKSLALYQDFEWLAPMSKHYHKIVQKLADRLVAVDLMPRAALLLKKQLQSQDLSHQERSTIATRLALVRLFQDNPAEAIQILDETEALPMPETLKTHRKIIRAKALMQLGQTEAALVLLEEDTSKNAILMRSEILWNAGRWGEASDSIKYLINPPEKGKPLTSEQISYILDWATALKKSGKETVLVRLRNKFMPYFKDTKYESAFNVLTSQLEDDKIDIEAINRAINEAAAFSNFAKIYANSLKNNTLSETIK